ncbi:MAG TPA: potassium transporter TrkA [Chloroflexi bacterium]|nr:potassium transporter TrkA [Chloroflexota bacterium]
MFVIVAGGGRVGAQLTTLLLQAGHKTRLIENRPQILERLHLEIPTEVIFVGDPTLPSVLDEAGLARADVVAATMPDDAHNLAISSFARFHYNVRRVIARINNPQNSWLFTPEMGVDVALSQADLIASIIQEEMSLGDMMTLLKLRRGKYSLVEEKIPQGAQAIGVAIKDMGLPDDCVIAAIIRDGNVQVPRGITTFEAEDEVLAITDENGREYLQKIFTKSP